MNPASSRLERWSTAVLLLAAFCAGGCGPRIIEPTRAYPVVPTPVLYERWAAIVADCAGLPNRSADGGVRWFLVAGDSFVCTTDGGRCRGLWVKRSKKIRIIYLASDFATDSGTVMHELLHDDLHASKTAGHPQPPFVKCAPM